MGDFLDGLIAAGDLGTQVFVFTPGGTPSFEDLTEDVGPGFGNALNKYSWSGQFFDGDGNGTEELYISTFNVQLDPVGVLAAVLRIDALAQTGGGLFSGDLGDLLTRDFPKVLDSDGGEVWRYDFASDTWSMVVGPDTPGIDIDDGDVGFREMARFDGEIFASTSRGLIFNLLNGSDNPAKIIVSPDGGNWRDLTGGPLDPAEGNGAIRSMEVVENAAGEEVLLVGTENPAGAQVWAYDAAGEWTKVATLPVATHAETAVFEGEIYLGTWAPYGLFRLDLAADNTGTVTDVTPDVADPSGGAIDDADDGVMQMIEFDGQFYLGSVNYSDGASLFRTPDPDDPSGWQVITHEGFDEQLDGVFDTLDVDRSTYTWQMSVLDVAGTDTLFIGDFNGERALLLESTDGQTFSVVNDDPADNPLGSQAYGVRKILPVSLDGAGLPDASSTANALIVGTADPFWSPAPLSDQFPPSGEIELPTPFASTVEGTPAEDILLGGGFGDTILAGAEDDWALGDLGPLLGGPDLVEGGDGRDRLFGNSRDDTVLGGEGEDLLVGGIGSDSLGGGENIDLILGDLTFGGRLLDIAGVDLGGGGGPPMTLGGPGGTSPRPEGARGGVVPLTRGGADGGLGEALDGLLGGTPDVGPPAGGLPGLPLGGVAPPIPGLGFPLRGETPEPGAIEADLAEIYATLFPAAEQVFRPVMGVGVYRTLEAFHDWYDASRNGGDLGLGDVLPDARFGTTPGVEQAFLILFDAIDAFLGTLGSGMLAYLDGMKRMAMGWDAGGPVDIPPTITDLHLQLHGRMDDDPEIALAAGTGPGLPGIAGPGAGLLGLPGAALGPSVVGALFTVKTALDMAAQEEFDQGLLDAILDFTGRFSDTIDGGGGNDIVFGGHGSDGVDGGSGGDVIYGDGGFDSLSGDDGDDILLGGNGNDTLEGGAGSDWHGGGDGSGDTAVFDAALTALGLANGSGAVDIERYGVANDDAATVSEAGPPVVIDIIGNDRVTETDTVLDDVEFLRFDDGSLGFAEIAAMIGDPARVLDFATLDTTGTRGTVSRNDDGSVTYDPDGQFEALDADETAEDTFAYTLRTGDGAEATATVTVTIEGVADPSEPAPAPTVSPLAARDDTASTSEDADPISIDVLGNDTSGRGPVSLVGVAAGTARGSVAVSGDGRAIEYDPAGAFNGLAAGEEGFDSFSYTVRDASGATDTATVRVTVAGENDAPRVLDTTVSTDTGFFFAPLMVDPDGTSPRISFVGPTSEGGRVDIALPGTLFYDPGTAFDDRPPGETVRDTFSLIVSDGQGGSDTADVTVFVRRDDPGSGMIAGGAGSEVFTLGDLSSRGGVDGGAGADTVVLPGSPDDYAVEPLAGGHRLTPLDPALGAAPQDLIAVETLQFDDATVAPVSDPVLEEIALFFQLTFGRGADILGLSFWFDRHEDGMALDAIADAFADSDEFARRVGEDAGNADFVAQLYAQGLGRPGDEAGKAFWTARLDDGRLDRGDMLAEFAGSEEMADLHANALDDGLLVVV